MNIDFYNEINHNMRLLAYMFKKTKIRESDINDMILLLNEIIDLLNLYLDDYINY